MLSSDAHTGALPEFVGDLGVKQLSHDGWVLVLVLLLLGAGDGWETLNIINLTNNLIGFIYHGRFKSCGVL